MTTEIVISFLAGVLFGYFATPAATRALLIKTLKLTAKSVAEYREANKAHNESIKMLNEELERKRA